MRRMLLYTIIILTLAGQLSAAKYAGEAFSLGVGARGLALGGAMVAFPADASIVYWNPAGMHQLGTRSAVAMHAETFGSLLNHDFIGYVDGRPRTGSIFKSFGFYLYYLGGGGIKITSLGPDNRPFVVREESHGDYLLGGSVSGTLAKNLDFGLTTKIIYRDIGTESGLGLTMDAGIIYRLHQKIRLGLMVNDLTTGFIRYSGKTFDNGANYESIYPTVKPGLMFEQGIIKNLSGRFLASADIRFENLRTASQYWLGSVSLDSHLGMEIDYKSILFGRAGFDIGRFTAGGGVDVRHLTIDIAYLHHDDFDETFRFSVGYRW